MAHDTAKAVRPRRGACGCSARVVGRPGWWPVLLLVPLVDVVVSVIVAIDLAKSFGKSPAFGVVGLWLFGIVGYPMPAFGSATYRGPSAA